MLNRPEHYYAAALERHRQAQKLRRIEEHSLAVYAFGLAVECLLRAFQPAGAVFDERHSVIELFNKTDWEVSKKQRRRLSAAISVIDELWHNNLRFADKERLESHWKARKVDRPHRLMRDLYKGADLIKVRCEDLDEACSEIIGIGSSLWIPN